MKMTLTTNQAARMLCDKNASWSWDAAFALCEYLQELEDGIGDEIEFCPVAIRCDWSEHASLEEWANDYGFEPEASTEDEREREEEIRDYIRDNGQLIEFDGGVIVSRF
jgi:hypothetical protein